jgi:hypothetical protein
MSARFSRINLLPHDSFEYSVVGKFLRWALTIGRALVILTEFIVILAFGSRFYYDKKLNDLMETIDQKQAVVESYAEIEKKARDILERQKIISLYLKTNLGVSGVFSSIQKITPPDVSYSQISLNETGINIVGTAGSETGFNKALAGVGTIKGIKEITVGAVDFDQRLGLINFKIRGLIKNVEK